MAQHLVDTSVLAAELRGIWETHLSEFFEGDEPEHVIRFSKALLEQLAWAIKSGDGESLATVKRSARLLAELGRIIVLNESWSLIDDMLDKIVGIGVAVLKGMIGRIE